MNTWDLIKSDWLRYVKMGGQKNSSLSMISSAVFCLNHCFAYIFWMRLANIRGPLKYIAKIQRVRLSRRYGIQISSKTKIGSGFYIGHGISIVINSKTVIGSHFTLSHGVTIGSNKGTPAIIGDNVYIGPNACIVENVKIT